MQNIVQKIKSWIKKYKVIAAIILIVMVGVVAYLTVTIIADRPRPLGNSFEYLGKEDYGCWNPLCTTKPTSYLYYGTDMNQADVARLTDSTSSAGLSGNGATTAETYSRFTFSSNRDSFDMTYYVDPQAVVSTYNLKSTHKKYIVSINIAEYETVRRSLHLQ